jgi:hypothetical protein
VRNAQVKLQKLSGSRGWMSRSFMGPDPPATGVTAGIRRR